MLAGSGVVVLGITKRPPTSPTKVGVPDNTGLVGLAESVTITWASVGVSPWKMTPSFSYWSVRTVPTGNSLKVMVTEPGDTVRDTAGGCASGTGVGLLDAAGVVGGVAATATDRVTAGWATRSTPVTTAARHTGNDSIILLRHRYTCRGNDLVVPPRGIIAPLTNGVLRYPCKAAGASKAA